MTKFLKPFAFNDSDVRAANRIAKDGFGIKCEQSDSSIDLYIYEFVGDSYLGTDSLSITKLLRENPRKSVNVFINSPGGFAYDGIGIFNALIQHQGEVTTIVNGIAASAASIIAMAGRPRKIAANGSIFIHRAIGFCVGNVDDMLDLGNFLEKLDSQIVDTYVAATGQEKVIIEKAIRGDVDGTTYTAEEALKFGLVDEILPPTKPKVDNKYSRDAVNQRISAVMMAK